MDTFTALLPFHLIIIVEDNKIDGFIIKAFLQDAGFIGSLKEFTEPQIALDFLEQELERSLSIQRLLIFLDLHMPAINGVEFLKALQLINPLTVQQVCILSSELVEIQQKVVKEFSVAGFISKPFNLEKLRVVLENISS